MSSILAVAEQPREQSELFFIATDKPHALVMVAQTLVVHLAKGRVVDGPALRAAMESALGASDAQGSWNWKDAYEAVEAAQVLGRYSRVMFARREGSGASSRHAVEIGALLPRAQPNVPKQAARCSSSRRRLNSPISRVWRRVWFPRRGRTRAFRRHGHAGDLCRDFWRNARF